MRAAVIGVSALACAVAAARWLRVAQREHYGAGHPFAGTWRVMFLWARVRPVNLAVLAVAAVSAPAATWWPPLAFATAAAVMVFPVGMPLRGRTAPLRWTRRLTVLAVVLALLCAGALALYSIRSAGGRYFTAIAVFIEIPALLPLAMFLLHPVEALVAARYVRAARAKLDTIAPDIVAVTGSYGKTSTKLAIAHLVAGSKSVVASPASYNNTAGLSRTINEHLPAGTEVLVAEMGTYGPGEIRAMCAWVRPRVVVITAIGPAHLERFGSLEAILAAKAEICELADVVVLNVGDAWIEELADRLEAGAGEGGEAGAGEGGEAGTDEAAGEAGRARTAAHQVRVVRCEAGLVGRPAVNVSFEPGSGGWKLRVRGKVCGTVDNLTATEPGNLACAVAAALELGVTPEEALARLPGYSAPPHRASVATAESGVTVVDDTYNANPAGAERALLIAAGACRAGAAREDSRLVVVTPGMVELGPCQREENERFASAVADAGGELVVVGRTNRAALRRGGGSAVARVVRRREDAVAWVRDELRSGDVVLYENDLPDHYP